MFCSQLVGFIFGLKCGWVVPYNLYYVFLLIISDCMTHLITFFLMITLNKVVPRSKVNFINLLCIIFSFRKLIVWFIMLLNIALSFMICVYVFYFFFLHCFLFIYYLVGLHICQVSVACGHCNV